MTSQRITASFCREQAATHRARAASEPLENRRKIALTAAKAWEAEALLREEHEAGGAALDKLDAEITLEFAREAALLAADRQSPFTTPNIAKAEPG
jgi:hypothetical protein